MRDHRARAIRLLGLIALLTAALPAPASAHPVDEYVQNTYIDLAPDRTTLQIDLTPGVLVAPEVVALIDADGDDKISDAEGEAYAKNAVLRDVYLAVDGEPQPLTLVDSSFPTSLDMGAGMGTIRLRVAAKAPTDSPGDHSLSYRNVHEPVNSRYLVNAFRASDGRGRDLAPGPRQAPERHPGGLHHRVRRTDNVRRCRRGERGRRGQQHPGAAAAVGRLPARGRGVTVAARRGPGSIGAAGRVARPDARPRQDPGRRLPDRQPRHRPARRRLGRYRYPHPYRVGHRRRPAGAPRRPVHPAGHPGTGVGGGARGWW
jgi:hypothetical protein